MRTVIELPIWHMESEQISNAVDYLKKLNKKSAANELIQRTLKL